MLYLISALCAAILALLVVLVLKARRAPGQDQGMLLFQQQLESLREQLQRSLSGVTSQVLDSQKAMGERLDNASRAVGQVQKSLGALGEATNQVFEVGKSISTLQEILRAPKLRGILGELFLSELLKQMLPAEHFSLQHAFKNGQIVDAVVRLGENLVPIDSKFPLENFRKMIEAQGEEDKQAFRKKFWSDVRLHVNAISVKYILPEEGTYGFALMYIPAENVYYETIINDQESGLSLCTEAMAKKVIPVSPNTLYAYLQAIVLGLRGMNVEKEAHLILKRLDQLKNDFARFYESYDLMGKHLNNARIKYDEASKRLERFEDRLVGVSESAPQQTELLPKEEESLPFSRP